MMNISEFERQKPRETLKQINKIIKISKELKLTVPKLANCRGQDEWTTLNNTLDSLDTELEILKKIFKEGK